MPSYPTRADCPECGGELLPTPSGYAVCFAAARGECKNSGLLAYKVPHSQLARDAMRAPTARMIGRRRYEIAGHPYERVYFQGRPLSYRHASCEDHTLGRSERGGLLVLMKISRCELSNAQKKKLDRITLVSFAEAKP